MKQNAKWVALLLERDELAAAAAAGTAASVEAAAEISRLAGQLHQERDKRAAAEERAAESSACRQSSGDAGTIHAVGQLPETLSHVARPLAATSESGPLDTEGAPHVLDDVLQPGCLDEQRGQTAAAKVWGVQ